MHYNEEQFAALAPFEDNFRTASEGHWTRRVSIPDQKRIKAIYTEATGERIPYNIGCGNCLLNLLKRAGRLYFEDKAERAAAAAAKKAPKTGAKSKNGKTTAKTAKADETGKDAAKNE